MQTPVLSLREFGGGHSTGVDPDCALVARTLAEAHKMAAAAISALITASLERKGVRNGLVLSEDANGSSESGHDRSYLTPGRWRRSRSAPVIAAAYGSGESHAGSPTGMTRSIATV